MKCKSQVSLRIDSVVQPFISLDKVKELSRQIELFINKSHLEISIEDSGLKGAGIIPLCSLEEESRSVQPGVPKDFLWDVERRRGGSSCPLPRLPQLGET